MRAHLHVTCAADSMTVSADQCIFGMGASIALMDSSCAAAVDASNNDFMYTTALDGYVVIILTRRFPLAPNLRISVFEKRLHETETS